MPDIASQYRTGSTGALYLRTAGRGWLRFDGADRLSFLQALLTNDVDAVKPFGGAYSLYLTPQGRLIADLELLHRGDHVLAGVPASAAAELATTFDRLIFSEDVQVTDVSASLATMTIVGARAAEIASAALRSDASAPEAPALDAPAPDATGPDVTAIRDLAPWSQIAAAGSFAGAFIARSDTAGDVDSFAVVMPSAMETSVRVALERAGAEPATEDFLEALRIDAARPQFGVDMTTETIPLEAGLLERAISQTKGCYVGQEVIIRVLHRGGGRVAKRLVQITAADEAAHVPPRGAVFVIDGKEAGGVTSSAWSPAKERACALGYVRREHADIGTAIAVQWTDAAGVAQSMTGTVTRIAG